MQVVEVSSALVEPEPAADLKTPAPATGLQPHDIRNRAFTDDRRVVKNAYEIIIDEQNDLETSSVRERNRSAPHAVRQHPSHSRWQGVVMSLTHAGHDDQEYQFSCVSPLTCY